MCVCVALFFCVFFLCCYSYMSQLGSCVICLLFVCAEFWNFLQFFSKNIISRVYIHTCTHSCQQIWYDKIYQKHFLSVVLSAFIQFSFTLIHMFLLYILMFLFLFFLFVLKFMLSYYFLAICLNFLFLFFFFVFAGILTFRSASFGESEA